MKEQLIHILDQSVCLSRKQMKEYISGAMQREEMHAAEIHLSSCPLCSMAMEGFETHSDEALAAIASLNSGFLKEHFDNIAPQIHLNSMAPAAALPASHPARKSGHGHGQPLWRAASIAAGIVLLFGVLWYVEFGRDANTDSKQIAMSEPASVPASIETARKATLPQPKDGSAAAKQAAATTEAPGTGLKPEPAPVNEDYAADMSIASNEAPTALAKLPERSAAAPTKAISPAYDQSHGLSDVDGPSGIPENTTAGGSAEKSASRQSDDLAILSTQASSTAKPAVRESDAETLKKKELAATLAERTAPSHMELGKESYDQGKYGVALSHYKKQMASGSPQDRTQAKIMASRCYAALGNKPRAQQLLQEIINEGTGPERRAARRTMRELDLQVSPD